MTTATHTPRYTATDDRRAAIIDQLQAGIAAIHDSESYHRYLAMQASFHRYSFGNTILIMLQNSAATHVAGFHAWLKLGRHVRKGEKGIAIMGPVLKRENANDPDSPRKIVNVKTVFVFDIGQTDGDPLPALDCPELSGSEGAALYHALEAIAHADGLTITTTADLPPHTYGYYDRSARTIAIRPCDQLQMTKTLAHELGHHLSPDASTRADAETIAESVAYVVCTAHGLATDARSLPYVAGWSTDQVTFTSALTAIQRTSARLLDAIEHLTAPDGRTPDRL